MRLTRRSFFAVVLAWPFVRRFRRSHGVVLDRELGVSLRFIKHWQHTEEFQTILTNAPAGETLFIHRGKGYIFRHPV
jgi:hypothetical protein